MKITICSSVDFSPKIIEIKKSLEDLGHEVNIPWFTLKIMRGEVSYEKYMNSKKEGGDISLRRSQNKDMIERYWNFIKKSDATLVLNLDKKEIKNYIGGSTLIEMGFAYGWKKKIFLFNPVPKRNEKIHYTDEILDMKPVIINGDLKRII